MRTQFWRTVLNEDFSEQESTSFDENQLSRTNSDTAEDLQNVFDFKGSSHVDVVENCSSKPIELFGSERYQLSQRWFPCPYCCKTFKQSSNQKKHIRQVHFKLKPYGCEVSGCGKNFSQKSVLRTHFKTVHMGERPFSCPRCIRKFSDKSNMRKHVRNLHLKEKRYECTQCSNKFGEKRSLHDHVNCVHLKLKPYICPVRECSRRFGQKTHMSKHFRTRHGSS